MYEVRPKERRRLYDNDNSDSFQSCSNPNSIAKCLLGVRFLYLHIVEAQIEQNRITWDFTENPSTQVPSLDTTVIQANSDKTIAKDRDRTNVEACNQKTERGDWSLLVLERQGATNWRIADVSRATAFSLTWRLGTFSRIRKAKGQTADIHAVGSLDCGAPHLTCSADVSERPGSGPAPVHSSP
ncbi:hypothetical protein AXG93_1467s1180 [Marchantia polymorpha subsp. ruderalis]|uniref:Uncharacterized protein n=1 Tax=Marchantia polymorpha subsp. ruderalis TaxID=1480154 RepID=A0A176WMP7_MARPO|nr:hypothetical protein AXG93_1467s1180 [Marchantia polymorpha subsp. ruderalis]